MPSFIHSFDCYVGITYAQELNDFGKVSFEALLKHFCAKKAPPKVFEISDKSAYSAVMVEFLTFKKIMWALIKSEKKYWFSSCMGPHQEQLWCATTSHPPNGVPCHTAIVERGFSLHRVIKNRLRNSLMVCVLDSLMCVSLMAPNPIISFDQSGGESMMLAADFLIEEEDAGGAESSEVAELLLQ